jgi:ADP-L-glycero-D-manno-heptose 6-epimerase
MIVITGAAGFIGSYLGHYLNAMGHHQLVLVDDFSAASKLPNHQSIQAIARIDRNIFGEWMQENATQITAVFHLGARTDTAEKNIALLNRLNLHYSQMVWTLCTRYQIPLLYASSAATYGNGEWGYSDDHALIPRLKPLNPYGQSKQDFDVWVIQQKNTPPHWYGFKFFNVYGPNEYHKGRMASVIFHATRQIQQTGHMRLFRSHRPDFADGEQQRDFVYVKDIAALMYYFFQNHPANGIYNAGTGKAETFLTLAKAVFEALGQKPSIEFIDIPQDIRNTYQYFTEANMEKVHTIGYNRPFTSLQEGIKEYVSKYLIEKKHVIHL